VLLKKIKELKAKDFIKAKFRFKPFGILEKREYNKKAFFGFLEKAPL
jgi:hypothetical protein